MSITQAPAFRRTSFTRIGLVLSAITLIVLSLCLGGVTLSPIDIVLALWTSITEGTQASAEQFPLIHAIVLHIRLPRVLAALLAGGALAVAGVISQGLFRNELASPDILGVSAGSSFGAVVAILSGTALLHPLMTPLFAIAGALVVSFAIYRVAGAIRSSTPLYLILCGLALSSLLGGLTMGLLLFAQQYQLSQFVFWTMGGLEGRLWQHILWPAPFILVLVVLAITKAKVLDAFALGELAAHGIGLDITTQRKQLLLLATLLTALSISIAGPIAFIGLMIPHLLRLNLGPTHNRLMRLSFVCGGAFLLVADLIGRWAIAPYEIKAGVIASVLGSSYLFYLIIRLQKKGVSL